jgi:long-chain fatty acid transport protein
MTTLRRGRVAGALLICSILGAAPSAHAAGFAIDNQGARAMGFEGAYVAQAADPSAIFYNAAGIAFLKRKQLYITGGVGSYNTDFTGEGPYPAAGTKETTTSPFTVLPSFYYTQPVSETVTIGLGVNRPYGYRAKWENPDTFTGRYICVECSVSSFVVNPTVAWRVRDRLSLGFGLDIRFAHFDLSRRLVADPSPFPTPKDVAELKIDSESDTELGFNVGLLAMPSESVSIGLAYRHKVKADFGATGTFTQIPTGDAGVDAAVKAALPTPQPAIVSFNFPANFAVGLAVKKGYWTIEGDLVWTFWSTFDSVEVRLPGAARYDVTLAQNYENTWQGRIGVEYLLSDTWAIRGGYAYDHGPQPTSTVSPFLHDSNRNAFGLGGTWKHGNFHLDLMGNYLDYRHRDTDGLSNYGYNGIYETSGFQFGLGFGWRF